MVKIVNGQIVREGGDIEAGTATSTAATSSSSSSTSSSSSSDYLFEFCGFKVTKWILGGVLLVAFLFGGFGLVMMVLFLAGMAYVCRAGGPLNMQDTGGASRTATDSRGSYARPPGSGDGARVMGVGDLPKPAAGC